MRAYRLNTAKIEALSLEQMETPAPGHGEVLIKVHAASLNFRDLMIATGTYARAALRPGLIPLSDGAGEVVEAGSGVTRVKKGDRVAGIFHQAWHTGEMSDEVAGTALGGDRDGMLAEYVVLSEAGVVKLPPYLSFEEAATLPCAAVTAWDALFNGSPVKPGEVVLVQGTGGVSLFALQFARAAGAHVIVTSSSGEKLKRAQSLGAGSVINYRDNPEWEAEVLRLTDGRGADHVVDVGGPGTLGKSLQAVRRCGSVYIIGVLTGRGEIDPMPILARKINVRGIFVGSRETFETMNRALSVNELRPVIDRVFKFEEAQDAYRYLQSGAHFGKVVIKIR